MADANAAILSKQTNYPMQTISQTEPEKYNIKKRLQKLDGTYNQNKYRLCAHLNKTVKTVEKWLSVKASDTYSITVDDLYSLADFFACSPTELINRP
jgi:hypothetical protein